jgi:Spy/CpxP family protein refolding chaperone
MNTRTFLAIAVVVLSIAATGPADAQVPPPQAPPQTYQQACPPRVTQSAQVLYGRYMSRFASLGLAPGQRQQIESLTDAFSRVHPAGSPFDPAAMRELRDQVRGVLTPQQLAMLQQQNHGHGTPHRCP